MVSLTVHKPEYLSFSSFYAGFTAEKLSPPNPHSVFTPQGWHGQSAIRREHSSHHGETL